MDGSTVSGTAPPRVYDETWSQQVEYQDIKAQQQLTKQHYGSPIGTPQYHPGDHVEDVKPDLGQLNNSIQNYSELERLSSEYQPELKGPLIGNLRSSKMLEAEYANADPAFVRKTMALSPKYTYYRTVRGDGNCGWRALVFGYFEILLRNGDKGQIEMEHARIKSLNGLLIATGLQSYIFEDFAQATFDMFIALGGLAVPPYDSTPLEKLFNNPEVSDSIVTHFKFLTAAWMKTYPDGYQPFLDRPVVDYCSTQIEPYGIEIDHVGLMALVDCLVLPAAFAVEIFYLDRSAGDEVNVHRFEKLEGDGIITPTNAPVLRLLYRPGHYDILYKREDIEVSAYAPEIHVGFVDALPVHHFQPTPASNQFAGFPPLDVAFFEPMHSPIGHAPTNFRPSMLSIPDFQPSPFQPLPFQTTTFRNSPFNPSHFQSENFQPEIYQPPTPTSPASKRNDR